jgi:hypothetical protein
MAESVCQGRDGLITLCPLGSMRPLAIAGKWGDCLMIVRVFVPSAFDAAKGPIFSCTDHNFPVLPSIGHVLRFKDEREGHFTVAQVGFIQDGGAFLAAVWLQGPFTKPSPIDGNDHQDRYRDLNYDVPPESMTAY